MKIYKISELDKHTDPIDLRSPGEYWYEYHCLESHESSDAQLWYRSHQRVNVVGLEDKGYGQTFKDRIEEFGQPAVYKIIFKDGFEGVAWEDEILDSQDQFSQDPPPAPKA